VVSRDRPREGVQAITLRLPNEIYDALKTVAFATDTSINQLAVGALADFLADDARRDAIKALGQRVQSTLEVDLAKLRR
jgi:predicted transcriptional regulator